MHSYYYVPSAGGFYHTSGHGGAIPSDAVAVADEEHAALMAAQAAGKAEAAWRLAPTDWMVTRQAEGGKLISAAVTAFRAAGGVGPAGGDGADPGRLRRRSALAAKGNDLKRCRDKIGGGLGAGTPKPQANEDAARTSQSVALRLSRLPLQRRTK